MALAAEASAADADTAASANATVATEAGSVDEGTALSEAAGNEAGTLKDAAGAEVVVAGPSALTATGTAATEENCSGPGSDDAAGAKLRTLAVPPPLAFNLAL